MGREPDFRAIVELLEDGISVVSRGKTLYRSPLWAKRLGESAQGEQGRSYFEFIVPADRQRVLALYREKLKEYDDPDPSASKPLQFDVELETESGERIIVDVKTHRFPGGDGKSTMLVMRDITRQKLAEQALRLSEERHRLVSELTSDFAFVMRFNEQGDLRTEWVTGAYSRITGYQEGEVWERGGWMTLVHPDDQPRAKSLVEGCLAGAEAEEELRFLTRDGETRWVRTCIRPLTEKQTGRVEGILGAVRDVTERKEAERALARRNEQLNEANRRLEQLHREKDEVTAIVSHELRSPLVTGLGYVELVLEGAFGALPEKAAHRIRKAAASLHRLRRLIDGLLQYNSFLSRDLFESGIEAPVDIAQLARDAVDDFLVRTRFSPEQLDVQVPAAPLLVPALAEPMKIVLENLLNNAADHAGDSARIVLSVAPNNNGRVRVAVSDDGVGVPDDLRSRVWGLFVKSQTRQKGLGIGLAVVQAILRFHQTEPHLESQAGQGATFWFELPRAGQA